MQMDMANFTLSQHRQLIGTYSAQIEFEEFTKLMDIDKGPGIGFIFEIQLISPLKYPFYLKTLIIPLNVSK